jgi:hypothetical protein
MARRKRIFTHYDKANTRLAALKSISPTLDLGNGYTVAAYETHVLELRTKQNTYNTTLSLVDQQLNDLEAKEKIVRDFSELILEAVAVKFGKNSNEYEMAGGTKKSEHKRPVRKAKAA